LKDLLQGDNRRIKSESQGEYSNISRQIHILNLQPPEAPLELWRMVKEAQQSRSFLQPKAKKLTIVCKLLQG
jgi:hypothetical protein